MIYMFTIIECDTFRCGNRFTASNGSVQPTLEALDAGWQHDIRNGKEQHFCPECVKVKKLRDMD